ncbi:hypothetical protein [Microbispora catharanthi]|uniref:Rpn family recombination-promoting nuclease/putative transposase n=1 Tax=Microbispora catharanthi TaxID=1712871 RepID=A0A5N6BKI9_9ACTN|nr:hypothetical protein [Microbispora catharanthi]KAB8181002.1 hypothetical protein FH610_030725 [Microbispora catharanthi]
MPKFIHQQTVDFFHNQPIAAVALLREVGGIELPRFARATAEAVDATQLTSVEYRADAVVVLRDGSGTARLAVIVEVQLRRDAKKRFSWPVYAAALRARLQCDTALLVICMNRAVGRWCEQPISMGPSGTVTPVAIHSDRLPLITDPGEARRHPELAVLSVAMNGDHPDIDKAMEVMLEGLNELDRKGAQLYLSYVFGLVPTVVGERLRELLMTASADYEKVIGARYFSEWVNKGLEQGLQQGREQGREQGRAEGEIEAILTVLDARGLDIPAEARERISRCSDLHLLEKWIRRAVTVTSVDELFV